MKMPKSKKPRAKKQPKAKEPIQELSPQQEQAWMEVLINQMAQSMIDAVLTEIVQTKKMKKRQ